MKPKNPASILLLKHLRELGLIANQEVRFHPERKWRFDFVLLRTVPDLHGKGRDGLDNLRIAIEIEGAIWTRGRHTRGKGFQADLQKYNHATMVGWRVLRFSTEDVLKGRAKAFLAEYLSITGGNDETSK